MPARTSTATALAAITLALTATPAPAGLIGNRAELNAQLGIWAITEDFESWTGEVLHSLSFNVLDADTIYEGQGPGIVNPGLRFTSQPSTDSGSDLQLDRRSQYGITSGSILGGGGTLVIDFLSPVSHTGFDYFQFDGYPDNGRIKIFAPDDQTLLYDSDLTFPRAEAPASTFFGYTYLNGIGSIHVLAATKAWSPLVDDLTYGNVIPEPATLSMIALGAAITGYRSRRRR